MIEDSKGKEAGALHAPDLADEVLAAPVQATNKTPERPRLKPSAHWATLETVYSFKKGICLTSSVSAVRAI